MPLGLRNFPWPVCLLVRKWKQTRTCVWCCIGSYHPKAQLPATHVPGRDSTSVSSSAHASQSQEWAQGLQVPQSLLCPTPMEGEARKRAPLHALFKVPSPNPRAVGMSLGLPVLANIQVHQPTGCLPFQPVTLLPCHFDSSPVSLTLVQPTFCRRGQFLGTGRGCSCLFAPIQGVIFPGLVTFSGHACSMQPASQAHQLFPFLQSSETCHTPAHFIPRLRSATPPIWGW